MLVTSHMSAGQTVVFAKRSHPNRGGGGGDGGKEGGDGGGGIGGKEGGGSGVAQPR